MSETVWPKKGDRMRFLGKNGYDHELEAAKSTFKIGQILDVEDCHVGNFHHSVKFQGISGRWNGVMFERVEE